MKMPAFAPSTPACHEPDVLRTLPSLPMLRVASPKYQTLPARSCAYQSMVDSLRRPRMKARSRSTVVVTPWMRFVRWVTSSTSLVGRPLSVPSRRWVARGGGGYRGLVTWRTRRWGSTAPPAGGAAAVVVPLPGVVDRDVDASSSDPSEPQ